MEHNLKNLAAEVWTKLDDSAKRRTSPENVLDTLQVMSDTVGPALSQSTPTTQQRSDVLTLVVQCPHCKLKMEIDRPRLLVQDATPCSCGHCRGERYNVELLDDVRCSSCNTPFNVGFPT